MPSFNGAIPPEAVERNRQYIRKRGHDLKEQLASPTPAAAAPEAAK